MITGPPVPIAPGQMSLGWYAPAGFDSAQAVADAGYDFVELAVGALAVHTAAGMTLGRERAAACPLPIVWNNFYPKDMRIVDPGRDAPALKMYFVRLAEFLHAVGGRTVVMGAAWSRNLPDGADRIGAKSQLIEALHWAADAFAGSGATIAFEPQNLLECNFIRRVDEAIAIVRDVNRLEVRAMADFYHMEMEQEPVDVVRDAAPWLAHIHLADTGRRHPGSGSYPYERFMQALAVGGYRGQMAVECLDTSESAMRDSLRFLRRQTMVFSAS